MKKNIYPILTTLIIFIFFISCRSNINEPPENNVIEEKPFIPIMMQIEYPSESLVFDAGDRCDIEWVVTQGLDSVKLVLVKKFKPVANIAQITENDGNFGWVIPLNLPPSHHYRIKIVALIDTNLSSFSYEFEVINKLILPDDD